MNNKVKEIVVMKEFFGEQVRVVNGDIVLKDFFMALGRLRADGQIEGDDRDKFVEMANLFGFAVGSSHINTKIKGVGRHSQELDTFDLDKAPMMIAFFKPTARAKQEVQDRWKKFIVFVNDLIVANKASFLVSNDKEKQLKDMGKAIDNGANPMFTSKAVNRVMAKLIGINGSIKKEELKQHMEDNPNITIDLISLHDEVRNKFIDNYEMLESHSEAEKLTLKVMKKRYPNI